MKARLNSTFTAGVHLLQFSKQAPPVKVFCEEDGSTVIQSRGQYGNPADYFARCVASEGDSAALEFSGYLEYFERKKIDFSY